MEKEKTNTKKKSYIRWKGRLLDMIRMADRVTLSDSNVDNYRS